VRRINANGGACLFYSSYPYLDRVKGTNINDAIQSALTLTSQKDEEESNKRMPLIVFLTDGQATSGITSSETMIANIKVGIAKN
jgi:Mg-chelatase subunit ChlD